MMCNEGEDGSRGINIELGFLSCAMLILGFYLVIRFRRKIFGHGSGFCQYDRIEGLCDVCDVCVHQSICFT